nr:TIGR04283 family arsenosugar biosynthesis glycosyltransferase [Limnobacter parvus]
MPNLALSVSIVMPVYNEVPGPHADSLTPRIQSLLGLLRPCDEVILVDGNSTDFSWHAIKDLTVHPQLQAIQSAKGRALQMNAGAAKAKGDILLFLHADTVLSSTAWHEFLDKINTQISTRSAVCVWGRFDVRVVGKSKWLPLVGWFINQRSRLSKIGTGDQALFVGRELFHQVGGFPIQPLMEDIALCKLLKQTAAEEFLAIRASVITSGRRWDSHGAWKTILLMWRLRFDYWRGVSPHELARQYADTRRKLPFIVAVFAKYPQPGQVKTRMEPLLGTDGCAAFARYLLLSTLEKLQGLHVVLWTDGGSEAQWLDLLNGRTVQRYIQPQGHLGIRMQAAVEMHLQSAEIVVLLGPDAVQFTRADLSNLVLAAKVHSIAFVPALDGGYVALACTRCEPAVFAEHIQWGTGSVAEQTRAVLAKQGVQAQWLDAQLDIDEPADLETAIQQGCVPVDWAERYTDEQSNSRNRNTGGQYE